MDGYKNYGFMYMIGNFIGMYCTDSGAEWFEGTDYTNEEQCQRMLASVEKMVNEYKDEPYVLMCHSPSANTAYIMNMIKTVRFH